MATNFISSIKLGEVSYEIQDTSARSDINTLKETVSKSLKFLGVTTTAIADGDSAKDIVIGETTIAAADIKVADVVIYNEKEFVYCTDNKFHEFGDASGLDNLGDFAMADEGEFTTSAFVTDVAAPTVSTTATAATVSAYTPAGECSKPNVNVELNSDTIQPVTSVGTAASYTLPTLTTTVSAEGVLEIAFSQGTFDGGSVPTLGTAKTFATTVKTSELESAPTFSGTEASITVTYDKTTSVSKPELTKTSTTVTVTPKAST